MDRQKIHKTLLNLKRALKDEKKGESFYLKVAEIAKFEGLNSAAEFFRNASKHFKLKLKQVL